MREYEFTIITRADLQDTDREALLGKYEALLYGDAGELIKKDDWGSKKLSFPIKKKFRGHYVFYDFANSEVKNLAEAERLLRIDDQVLRFMLVKTRDKVDVEARKVELAKAETQRQAGSKDRDRG